MNTRIKFFLPLFIGLAIFSVTWGQQTDNCLQLEKGLHKVAILYPNGDDTNFNMEYYENKHMPMVAGLLGDNLKYYEIDLGISGRTPNDLVPYVAIGYFYIKNISEYNKSILTNRDRIIGDFKNYTNVKPVIQISKIRQIQ